MGRILEIIIGYDNKIRSVKLKRGDGQICHHSLNHLYPLELSLTHSGSRQNQAIDVDKQVIETDDNHTPLTNEDPGDELVSDTDRPKRAAAKKCRAFIQSKLDDL